MTSYRITLQSTIAFSEQGPGVQLNIAFVTYSFDDDEVHLGKAVVLLLDDESSHWSLFDQADEHSQEAIEALEVVRRFGGRKDDSDFVLTQTIGYGPIAIIEKFEVMPERRKKGVGTASFRLLLQFLQRAHRIRNFILKPYAYEVKDDHQQLREDSLRLMTFYGRFGFRITFGEGDSESPHMALTLADTTPRKFTLKPKRQTRESIESLLRSIDQPFSP